MAELDGVRCVPSAAALPGEVDLAVAAAPAAPVPAIAEECWRREVRALVVITAGLDGAARMELLGICRRHGMRLVWPASFGVANTSMSLDATLAARHPMPGSVGRRRSPAASASAAAAPVPAGRRDLLVRLAGRQRRRVRQRHAAVVRVRPGDQAAVSPGVVR